MFIVSSYCIIYIQMYFYLLWEIMEDIQETTKLLWEAGE